MPKKYLVFMIIIILLLIGGGIFLAYSPDEDSEDITGIQCEVDEMVFYYLKQCTWCQKVKNDGTISKIKELGVEVKEVDAEIGPIQHQFKSVPTFVIDGKIYSGYKTFEELKGLLRCSKEESQSLPDTEFVGEKGEKVSLADEQIKLESEVFIDNSAHYYNTELPNGKIVFFFVIKDKEGIYRAAANACQVCFDTRMGFSQEGDYMVCNTCGNKYPLEKIATEKGGCNPGPINPNLEVKDGQIIIEQSDIEQVAEFF